MENHTEMFAAALRRHLSEPKNLRERRLLALIDSYPSRARTRRLRVLEARAALEIGKDVGEIDWDKVKSWAKIILSILSIILMVL